MQEFIEAAQQSGATWLIGSLLCLFYVVAVLGALYLLALSFIYGRELARWIKSFFPQKG